MGYAQVNSNAIEKCVLTYGADIWRAAERKENKIKAVAP